MPSSKSKQKRRSKANGASANSGNLQLIGPSATCFKNLTNDLKVAEGWYSVIEKICQVMGIPDLSSRQGLEQIHQRFPEISQNLERLYVQFIDKGNDGDVIVQGIVALYTRMCADSDIRDRVIKDTGLFNKLFSLLDRPSCCVIALQALCAISQHGGWDARSAIAMKSSVLLQVLENHRDDSQVAELTFTVLAHSTMFILQDQNTSDTSFLRAFDIARQTRLAVAAARLPTASVLLLNHILGLLVNGALHSNAAIKACSSAVNFLIAFTRGPDVLTRADALLGVMHLYLHTTDTIEPIQDPMHAITSLVDNGWPAHINDVIVRFGTSRLETCVSLDTTEVFHKAIVQVMQDRDFYAMGKAIGPLITRTELSVVHGAFEMRDPQARTSGKALNSAGGLPFTIWADALPFCVKAIREKGIASEQNLADTIELKYLLVSQKLDNEANIDIVKRAIERNPRNGYFYLVLARCPDQVRGLRAAKKGLKCPNLTDYLRTTLLFCSVTLAARMGLDAVHDTRDTKRSFDEGVAFLTTALEDAKKFIECASPDNRNMPSVIDWYMILILALYGAETSPTFEEHRDIFKKLEITEEISQHLGRSNNTTQTRLARIALVERLPPATKEWGSVVSRFTELSQSTEEKRSSKRVDGDLAAWLDDLHVKDDDCNHGRQHQQTYEIVLTSPKVSPNTIDLYRCSWCCNPSALLRKCSSCEKTRYCDAICQKEHWKEHRKSCKREPEIS
ncbi:hypothetical protein DFH11DRAFT_1516499 [Phellopilus nigrolimitatus]|nr:hypothetical protein DFH11DRAFT_1516499 [Phellopilus nigrolimitatus]